MTSDTVDRTVTLSGESKRYGFTLISRGLQFTLRRDGVPVMEVTGFDRMYELQSWISAFIAGYKAGEGSKQ